MELITLTGKTHLREFFETYLDLAQSEFKEMGRLQPCVYCELPNGDVGYSACPPLDEATKDAMANHLRRQFRELGVQRYAFVAEAWVTQDALASPTTEGPEPEEMLVIQVSDGQQVISAAVPVISETVRWLGEPEIGEADQQGVADRFGNLLGPDPTTP